jgi:hypothetical protein
MANPQFQRNAGVALGTLRIAACSFPVINRRHSIMNNLIWLVGAVVIVLAILSFLGLR